MSGTDIAAVAALDAADSLAPMRQRFVLPEGLVYLDGNSLGALPVGTAARLREVVEDQWGKSLIGGWNMHGWVAASRRVGARIAPLIGAPDDCVVVADSTSVNLYKLIVAALKAKPERRVVVSEPGNFPTDLYMAAGAAWTMSGIEVRTAPADRIVEAIEDDVALVLLTHVHYKTGRKHDMAGITRAAHDRGALVLWDLSHSAGAVAVDLEGCDADLAVGCGYKYLNGGPGAPAFLYVAQRHHASLRSPLSGWFGHAAPFAFRDDYAPSPDISRFLCGTPPILGIAALDEGVSVFADVDRDRLWDKSQALCSLFIKLMDERCAVFGFELVTARDPTARGSHVSYAHRNAHPICQALIANGVVGDFRAPDVLRLGFTPLYTRFADVWAAVETIERIMAQGEWDRPEHHVRAAVT
ncbi:kynureninase [Sphingomonas sp.]|uniref:kynureninase n=1 Tax=Sphingomonas sp. TaxID=28214 RepID=UPI003B0010F9